MAQRVYTPMDRVQSPRFDASLNHAARHVMLNQLTPGDHAVLPARQGRHLPLDLYPRSVLSWTFP